MIFRIIAFKRSPRYALILSYVLSGCLALDNHSGIDKRILNDDVSKKPLVSQQETRFVLRVKNGQKNLNLSYLAD